MIADLDGNHRRHAALRDQVVLGNRYVFESESIRAAYALISETERKLLPWNPEQIDWKSYWVNNQIKGIERWVQPEAVKAWTFRI